MALRLRHIARSVFSNWFAMAASLAVGFFLSPFIVHRLGNVAYGVWILAVSSINYLGLLDLGMASSVVRYVSKGYSTGNHVESSEALGAVLWVRLQISALILIISGGLTALFPVIFKVPAALIHDARLAILLIGISTMLTISLGVFSSTLSALNRYDLRSYVTLVQLAVRVVGVVIVLQRGMGIVAIAVCELAATIIGNVLLMYLTHRVYPELTLRLKKPAPEILRKIWSYSAYAFIQSVAIQLIYQSDNLVVGAFITATAVTFYSIGNTLCRYTQQLISAMTITFTPAASTYQAAGDDDKLRALFYNGTRATIAISLPIVLTLIIRGRTFIGLWMGPQYAGPSGIVLALLATALLFSLQNSPASSIAYGIEKHKILAKWAIIEGIANLALSIILVRKFGIYGVALGTLIPNLVISLVLWPRYVSQLVGLSTAEVFREVWGPIYLSAVPFCLASYAVDVMFPARNVITFGVQTVLLCSVFGLTLLLVFRSSVKRQLIPRVKAMFGAFAK